MPIEGCYPFGDTGGETGGETGEEPEGLISTCSGTGNGWIRTRIFVTGPGDDGSLVRYNCVNPPPGVAAGDLTAQHCIDNPLDLEGLTEFTGDAVPNAEACCGELTLPEPIEEACVADCAYAACKLAVLKIKEAAASAPNNAAKADLLAYAAYLETPTNQATCAQDVIEAAPSPAPMPLGEGPGDDQLGHIEDLILYLQCDVTSVTTLVDSCTESANKPDLAATEQGGSAIDGAVTFSGPYGDGSTAVEQSIYTVSSRVCRAEPCPIELSQLDVDLASFSAQGFEFVDPQLELETRAGGWRTGTAVTMPIGALTLRVSTSVKVEGEFLFGPKPFEFEFSNSAPVVATLDPTGHFSIEEAEFNLFGETAVLNIQ